jgi:SpoVK/Ycf46/Vps4 family AAA+-type ATPase
MKNYKFKTLKIFASDEWLANRTREYRTVYDKSELTYVSAELAFYNKLFDESDWEANVRIRAFSHLAGGEKKEISNQEEKRKVRLDENVVYVNKGWGTAIPGTFWAEGEYSWEAYIDEELVGTKNFFVESVGQVTLGSNPYFDLKSIRFFTGDYNAVNNDQKVYLRTIDKNETQYLYIEFTAINKLMKAWNCEIVFNWYNAAGLLKARIERFRKVKGEVADEPIIFNEGWGNDTPGTWKDSNYRLEITFMDCVIAILHVKTGDEDVEGEVDIEYVPHAHIASSATPAVPEESLEMQVMKLDELVGLEELKKEITDHISYLNFIKIRKERGFNDTDTINLHSVFVGNPGTGKTTVVKRLGQIYKSMGLLSKGHVKEVDRSHLIGEYIGQTAPKVKKVLEEAKGGILFIDEAYALSREGDDAKDFGKEAIEVLIKEMSDGSKDLAVMFAGYPKEMDNFLKSNPGLKSRIGNYFHFEDFTPDELHAIANRAAIDRHVVLTEDANNYLGEQLMEGFRNRDRTFGNARYAISLIEEAKMNLGLRMMKRTDIKDVSKETLSTIEKEDIELVFKQRDKKKYHITINEKLLQSAMDELNALVGIDSIKNEINELVKLIRFYNDIGKDVLNKFSLHTVFLGNPGTGKTTVARIMGKIFKALGLLERGHMIELDKQGLVAGYVGQTAIKTDEKIRDAKGGVLFIDEAYALSEGNDFGREAIETLLKRMEDMRGDFAVIAAGYTEPMNRFLESNPGLKSRFDRIYTFNDYSTEELFKIAVNLFRTEKVRLDDEAYNYLQTYITHVHNIRDKYFGNAREIRKMVQDIIQYQNLRLAGIPKAERTTEMLDTITIADLNHLKMEDGKRKGLGFKY